ncbi:succinyl-CoA synthetase alpha subunit [Streptomyces griseochromogenes]|uniref:Succinyl-CoA synthetase alpha subunit n=1 Tax=Streptomyces griseochromogenes TaxID=68214 RepID=A0A1B1AVP4_9ACTN|nr:hypothetical protein AVL59_14355 [Streptomyces griseochromogenes]MBP2051430.1 succinyl-CoA synthetase alpha subunit [Streptomyces griseochromogenes]
MTGRHEVGRGSTAGVVPLPVRPGCRSSSARAADAGIGLAVVITEGVPVHDTVTLTAHAERRGTRVIGPNRPGLITPGRSVAGVIPAGITKPVVGCIAGFTAPEGRTMGHAGAIVSGSTDTARATQEALEAIGVRVGGTPTETARLVLAQLPRTQ